ncbi:MAG: PA2778 family cysteine peptidase [Desulfobulbaceae bacterium]
MRLLAVLKPVSRPAARLFSLSLLFTLAGCGASLTGTPAWRAGHERVLIDTVPFFAQEEYQCGPAALAMLLAWSGVDISPDQLTPMVYSPSLEGSLQPAMVAAARRHGRIAHTLHGPENLMVELEAGHPVLVLQNLGLSWFPRWHYAVVTGYDRGSDSFYLHSGVQAMQEFSARLFARTWARSGYWGLLVLPPGRLPATATEKSFSSAAAGLERTGRLQAAIEAYEAALRRWPTSFVLRMGLGNSLYALGDMEGAEKAFRGASVLRPDNGEALNNLAVVLAATGRREEALSVIERAIGVGGAFQQEFIKTRQEILAGENIE